ncbi:hypothetical protein Tco_0038459 [Tanacetum coccineum]
MGCRFSKLPTDPHHTPIITQPSSSQPQRKQKSRKSKKKNTEVPQPIGSTDNVQDENIPTTSNDSPAQCLGGSGGWHPNLGGKIGDIDAEREVEVEKVVSTAKVTTESATTTIVDELTLAHTLIEIKAAKPKVRGVMIQEPSEFTTITTTTTPAASKPLQEKVRNKMIESERPLKRRTRLEEERLTRQMEEEANIALIESWDNTQAMMDADYQMAQQLQANEQEKLSIKEKSKLFVQLLEARKKHFEEIRAREKRNKLPTQAKQRKLYCNYLKNMEGYTLKQLKGFKFEVINDMFDKAFKRVNTFFYYKTELVEGCVKRAEDSTKRAGTKLEQEVAKKQKINDAKVDDDQEEARMKEFMNIVPDEEEVAIDAIPLATKPLCIVDWKVIKEEKNQQFQIIRADRSSKSPVWRTLQNEKVLIWKLFDSCGVQFLRLQSMHIFMLVEKRYPLTPATITGMLIKKLQADHWNEMCYQLLKLITKQLKNPGRQKVKAITTMGKENMKESVPLELPPTPFIGHLKEQIGDMDVSWDITNKDVERLRQFLTPTIHTVSNLEPVVQLYILLGPVQDMDKVVKEKKQDYDIPLNNNVRQPLTPQTVHITPSGDDYVAPATNSMSNKQLNKFEKEFSNITKGAKKEYDNHVIETYDYEDFIRKLLHQVSQSSREMKSQQQIQHLRGNYRGRLDSKSCGNLDESAAGIKSLREDGDNLKDFRQISNLKAMLREFLGIKRLREDGNDLKIFAKFQISKQCSGSFLA